MATFSSGSVRKLVEQQVAAVKDAVRGTREDAARPTAIQRSRARRALRREVRTQQEGLSRAWMFTGRRDRLMGGLAGVAVVAAAAGIVWLGGGQKPVGATGFSPSAPPTVSPTTEPTASVSPHPSPILTSVADRDTEREPYPGVVASRGTDGTYDGRTTTGSTSTGTSGTGGTASPTQTQPSPTQTEPSPTQTEPSPTETEPSPTDPDPAPSHPDLLG
jgi:hypothetical protein